MQSTAQAKTPCALAFYFLWPNQAPEHCVANEPICWMRGRRTTTTFAIGAGARWLSREHSMRATGKIILLVHCLLAALVIFAAWSWPSLASALSSPCANRQGCTGSAGRSSFETRPARKINSNRSEIGVVECTNTIQTPLKPDSACKTATAQKRNEQTNRPMKKTQ